jgi:hypothetical protein
MRTTTFRFTRCSTARRFWFPVGALVLALLVFGLQPQTALAQTGVDAASGTSAVFQLEGNTKTDASICFGIASTGPIIATPAGGSCPSGTSLVSYGAGTEDWDKISSGTTSAMATTGIINDAYNSATDNSLCGGSTKDPNDFSQWQFCEGKAIAKDDFEHGYAAAYTRSSDSHVIIVAGVDRYSNSGSSTAGFWFVQDPHVGSGTVDASGTPVNCAVPSGCAFGGTHKNGDILIISQFTQGGAVSTIQVFSWIGDGAAGSISAAQTTGTQCDPRSGSATALCGTVNGVPVLSGGWTFASKPSDAVSCDPSGTGLGSGNTAVKANCMSVGEFLEIGFDLTNFANNVLGGKAPCISKFFAETRASGTGITSVLSDFITPHSFPLCTLSATKTCSGASFVSASNVVEYDFTGTITATGGTFSGLSVSDSPNNGNTTGISNVVVTGPCSNAGPYGAGNTCNSVSSVSPGTPVYYAGSFDSATESNSLPNNATVTGTTPEGEVVTIDSSSWLTGNPPSNGCTPALGALALTKSCFVTRIDSNLGIHVHFTGTVTNNSGITVNNVMVTDTPAGQPASGNLLASSTNLANGGVASFSGDYIASQCSPINSDPALTLGGFTVEDNGRCQFSDTVNASGTGAVAGSGSITAPGVSAMCNICPAGTDTNGKAYCGN